MTDHPTLCPDHTEAVRRMAEHSHTDPDITNQAAAQLARQCPSCIRRNQ